MKKIIYILFFLIIVCSNIEAQTNTDKKTQEQKTPLERERILEQLREKGDKILNINNLFEINIPENIEIVSINQYLLLDEGNTQYGVSNTLSILFEKIFFYIEIDIYGNTNLSLLDGNKTYNLRKIINPGPYMSKNQVKHLKENYIIEPFSNKNQVIMGKFFSSWGTSSTSDYYGLFFTLPNKEFNECVISIDNIWGTFAKNKTIDENYKAEIMKTGGNLEKIFNDLDLIENSITYKLTDKSIKIGNGCIGEQIIEVKYIYPAIDNLRMRSRPSLTGEVLGYMKKEMYSVVVIGEEDKIDGGKGNWLLIIPWHGNSAAWVFSGYTRKATNEEMDKNFGW